MNEHRIHKLIAVLVLCIVAYHILSVIFPYLFYGVIALVLVRVAQEYFKNKRW